MCFIFLKGLQALRLFYICIIQYVFCSFYSDISQDKSCAFQFWNSNFTELNLISQLCVALFNHVFYNDLFSISYRLSKSVLYYF